MIEEQFNTNNYPIEYENIRSFYLRFNPIQLIFSIVHYINTSEKINSIEALERLPWAMMLLIKWIIEDPQSNIGKSKKCTTNDVIFLRNKMNDLQTHCKSPSSYKHYHLFFRNITFQQFIYQNNFSPSIFSRQMLLFCSPESPEYYNKIFSRNIGLSIHRFLELSIAITVVFTSHQKKIVTSKDWFRSLIPYFSENEVETFLNSISLDYNSIRQYLNSIRRNKESREYYEQTPILRWPLLKVKNDFLCWHPNILFRSLESFIYDRLKEIDAERFMDSFGGCFESYVAKSLDYSGCNYKVEKDLRVYLKDTSLIDFLIIDENSNIYMDAKAVEINRDMRNTYNPSLIKDKLKSSIIKAIDQAHSTYNNIGSLKEKYNIHKTDPNDQYILVVTFKEMYIGNGKVFYESAAESSIEKIYSKYEKTIPLENMYFITIEELDLLSRLIREGKTTFSNFLNIAKGYDEFTPSMKFDFLQHLQLFNELKPPEYIHEATDKVFSGMQSALFQKEFTLPNN